MTPHQALSRRRESATVPTVSLEVNSSYRTVVKELIGLGETLKAKRAEWVQAFVTFCVRYGDAYSLAKKRGNECVRELNAELGITDKTFANKARDVAKHAALLKEHLSALPESREALVEAARMESRSPGSLVTAIERGTLGKETSVRAIRSRSLEGSASGATEDLAIRLVASDRDALARIATAALREAAVVVRVADATLRDLIKIAAGPDRFGEIEARLTK